jgi:hypothetical protein
LQNFGFNITTDFLEGDHATPIVDFVLRQTRSKVVTSVSNYVTKNTQ